MACSYPTDIGFFVLEKCKVLFFCLIFDNIAWSNQILSNTMKNMYPIYCFALTILLFLSGYIARSENRPPVYDRVQEKVYLHFDNGFYFTGDTIWYKAYVVNSDSFRVGPSRVLYVDLLDAQGYVQDRQKLVIDLDGQASGRICLRPDCFSGYYEVRAYTRWMQSFCDGYPFDCHPDNFFSRVLPVYDRPDSAALYGSRIMKQKVTAGNYRIVYDDPPVNASFFPEGGNLIGGVPCLVAYEAENERGRRINVDGELLRDGIPTGIKVLHTYGGRGSFRFTPSCGSRYSVRLRSGGKDYDFDLPAVFDSGCALSVSQTDDSVSASVSMVFDSIPEAWAVFSCRGRVIRSVELDSSSASNLISIPSDILPTGVNMLSIVTDGGMILSERMFFVRSDDLRRADVEVSESSASPLAPCSVSVSLTDSGVPLRGARFSISVTDGGQTDESFYSGGNVLTELLLQSDLRGFIENPGWYFRNRTPSTLKALDELVLVHGWRRYDISSKPDSSVQPETAMQVSGRVYNVRKDYDELMDGPAEVYASIHLNEPGHDGFKEYSGSTETDSLDRFVFAYTPFYGTGTLNLRALKSKDASKPSKRFNDPGLFIRYDDFSPKHVKSYSWYEENKPDYLLIPGLTAEDVEEGIYASEVLPEVDVTEGKIKYYNRMMDKPVVSYDFLDVLNAVYDRKLYTRYEKFSVHTMDYTKYHEFIWFNIILGENLDGDNFTFMGLCLNRKKIGDSELNPIWSDDGKMRSDDPYGFIRILEDCAFIDRIDIITDFPRRETKWIMNFITSIESEGAYMNVIRFPEGRKRHIVIGREIKLRGFNRPVEYYNPDYSRKKPEVPDYRRTLYWNADAVTDDEGRAEIRFFNNSICKDFKVSIEAVTPDGTFISY